jgi:hypothetical protein
LIFLIYLVCMRRVCEILKSYKRSEGNGKISGGSNNLGINMKSVIIWCEFNPSSS